MSSKTTGNVMAGTHFLMGNIACAEGAIAAGCNFAAGYPITPATEIINHLAKKLPLHGGIFLQTEDEISAISSIVGASWSGCKVLTATSGPGISLMQENIGFAVATETPLVIIDVQRLGPSTGVPSIGLAGDIVQVARGSHGDYQIIALCPDGPQEMFDLTVRAFNLSEKYRVPVFLMAEGFIGHMRERVVIPDASELSLVARTIQRGAGGPMQRQDFLDAAVAPMPVFGNGLKSHVTSSCHDEHGMRNLSDPEIMHKFITKPIEKIMRHRDDIIQVEKNYKDCDIVLVAYGSVSRSAKAAAELARADGLKVGIFRFITCWPFPGEEIREMAESVKHMIVLENNCGQLFPYIKAEAAHACRVDFIGPQTLGQIHDPEYVLSRLKEMVR
ncbi:MAG: 2-oxoacid:acceptor oxidoreductase subunit alpha [Desulfobacteraceae bacterium]|nr:2-oxoacid:acceptor oxidoreductase subunit alpha [Desulfobacteraceae bacterium]